MTIMKLKTLCTAILATTLATGGAVSAFAAEVGTPKELGSTGTVIVDEAGDTEDENSEGVIVDPEEGGTLEPDEEQELTENTGSKGPLKLESLTPLDFGTISGSTSEINQPALPTTWKTVVENGAPVNKTRGAMVEFADVRSGVSGYTVSAQLTKQFEASGKTLDGSSITYSNAIIRAEDQSSTQALPTVSGFELTEGGAAQTVVTAAEDTGKGRFVIEFGQSTDYAGNTTDTTGDSVILTVPSKTASTMVKDTYSATVLWTIAPVGP